MAVEFDQFTVALLVQREDAPALSEEEASALQDAHMAHLADLHAAGHLVAAGPLRHERFRGLSVLVVDVETAQALKDSDPAVRAGRFDVVCMPWMVPKGAVRFSPARFPRSMADVS